VALLNTTWPKATAVDFRAGQTDEARMSAELTPWWGTYDVDEDTRARFRIGPLELSAERRAREWRVHSDRGEDPLERTVEVEVPASGEPADDDGEAVRFTFARAPAAVHVAPALADRPVVLRPEDALHVPAREHVKVFVSTPVWVGLRFGESASASYELPSFRPSDTWFGPTTQDGELCYANRTRAFLDLEAVVPRPHRAVTVVAVHNRGDTTLSLERIKVPVPHLSVFASDDGRLWTERVTLERAEDEGFAQLTIGDNPDDTAGATRRLSEPRLSERHFVIRAFEALFRERA
jgi:hypothetical protein